MMRGVEHKLAILAVSLCFFTVEWLRGHLATREITPSDWRLDLLATGTLAAASPAIVLCAAGLASVISPGSAGAWADLPVWSMVLLFLVGDDLLQYWWHRASHSVPLLYTLLDDATTFTIRRKTKVVFVLTIGAFGFSFTCYTK